MSAGAHSPGSSTHQVLGYTLRKFLAQGGMAELFLAQPTDPARGHEIVVVKRVLPQFVQDQQFARMFAREASLASMLKHPNIVEVFDDRGATEAECFFAMEYVHGPDLNMLLKQLKEGTRPVPLEHALQIAMGMCQGLHYAHECRDVDGSLLSIVHRDVSPSNVMLSDAGIVKITDFGVAKALALTSFTQAGTRKGKLSYMSPEQAVADPVDRRTDIFAIGTVLFEMTTLQRMFGGENELAIMHKLLFRERPRPSAIRHDYPPELESIVLKAVAQKPEDRFDSALEMHEALAAFAERRRLQSSPAHLARWVGSIIPPKPHPASDPAFATSHASATVLPIQRKTVVADDTQATISDSGLVGTGTTVDIRGPATMVGQLQPVPASSSDVRAVAAIQPGAPAVHVASTSLSGTRSNPVSSSSALPAIAIVSGAVAVGAVILAGALWYAEARRAEPATSSDVVEPAPAAETPSNPPTPMLQPGVVPESPRAPSPSPDVSIPTPTSEPTPTPASAPVQAKKPRQSGSTSRKRRTKRKPRNSGATPPTNTKPPAPQPTPASPPPAEEPSSTKPARTDSLDELFPGYESP